MKTFELEYFKEPELTFGNGQTAIDPRDGLLLFGPNEKYTQDSVKVGVIGTPDGINLYSKFVERLQLPIFSEKKIYGNDIYIEPQRPSFMGFEATFGIEWSPTPILQKNINPDALKALLKERTKKEELEM